MPLTFGLISYGQAVVLGLLQGVSELFPISSLGHSVILPQLLGWDIHQNDDFFITFLVATHLATALVLLGFFWQDWVRILKGLGRSLQRREVGDDPDARLGWLLVVGTIPAGLLGLLLEDALRGLFASGQSAAFFPGHEAGSSHHHVKHGIAAFLLGVAALVLAWFQSGPRDRRTA